MNMREMAEALGIPEKNYESYEKRTPLPHHLILQFARVARVPVEYLFTGRMAPPQESAPEAAEAVGSRGPRKQRVHA
jgi:hypothetical protein